MGTHLIPRSNVKGQDRFFIFFSVPGLIGTVIALLPSFLIFSFLDQMGLTVVGFVIVALFGFVGFIIGQGKIPDTGTLPIFKAVGGLYVRDVIKMYLRFKKNKKKFVLEMTDNQEFDVKEDTEIEKLLANKLDVK